MEAEVGGRGRAEGGAGGGGARSLEEAVHVDDGGPGNEGVEEGAEGAERRHGAAEADRVDPQVPSAAFQALRRRFPVRALEWGRARCSHR